MTVYGRNEHQSEPPPALYVRHIGKIGLLFLRSIIAVSGGGAATFAAHSMAEMDPAKREILKDQLRLMAAGRGNGIDLDSPERWAVEVRILWPWWKRALLFWTK